MVMLLDKSLQIYYHKNMVDLMFWGSLSSSRVFSISLFLWLLRLQSQPSFVCRCWLDSFKLVPSPLVIICIQDGCHSKSEPSWSLLLSQESIWSVIRSHFPHSLFRLCPCHSSVSLSLFTHLQGEVIGLGLSGSLVKTPDIFLFNHFQIGSWDSSFYLTSLFGLLWFPLYSYFVFDSPAEHPRISDEEYQFIREGSVAPRSLTPSLLTSCRLQEVVLRAVKIE
jgi:hypothetical protein